MQVKLNDCLQGIRAGQTFKKPLDQYAAGDLAVILPKHVIGGRIENATYIDREEVSSLGKHLLKKGEILIINKGAKFNSFLYQGDPAPAVATTAFYILTPMKNVLPEYLNWYLTQKEAKNYFLANTRGAVIPIITKDVLADLPVPLIPLKEQKYILSLANEFQIELALLRDLTMKREEFGESYIWEHIKKCL